jgi:hypothetical protein
LVLAGIHLGSANFIEAGGNMALKPRNTSHFLGADTQRLVDLVAGKIEVVMNEFASVEYSGNFVLERYSEITWNVSTKPSLFKRRELLLAVRIPKSRSQDAYPKTNGKYLEVIFSTDASVSAPSEKKASEFCEILSSATALPIRCRIGSKLLEPYT